MPGTRAMCTSLTLALSCMAGFRPAALKGTAFSAPALLSQNAFRLLHSFVFVRCKMRARQRAEGHKRGEVVWPQRMEAPTNEAHATRTESAPRRCGSIFALRSMRSILLYSEAVFTKTSTFRARWGAVCSLSLPLSLSGGVLIYSNMKYNHALADHMQSKQRREQLRRQPLVEQYASHWKMLNTQLACLRIARSLPHSLSQAYCNFCMRCQ